MKTLSVFKKNKEVLPEYFKTVLWSYDFKSIDPLRDKKTIIVNAINYGDLRHWRWLAGFYGKRTVADVLRTIPVTEIRLRAGNLASIIFSINNFNYEPRSSDQVGKRNFSSTW